MQISKIQEIRNHYIPRVKSDMKNYDVLDWASQEGQQLRFEQLLRFADLEGKTLLDVGCGLADLPLFISSKQTDFDYIGVDILPEMISRAEHNYPAGRFFCTDLFSNSRQENLELIGQNNLDVIYCSGALNLNLGNNDEFIKSALTRMIELADEMVVVTLLHARAFVADEKYFAYYPADIMKIVLPLCKDVRVVDDYLYNDFTLVCQC